MTTLIVHFNWQPMQFYLMLRSKVLSAFTYWRRSLNTGLFKKEHCVHHTKQVFSQLPHAATPLKQTCQ